MRILGRLLAREGRRVLGVLRRAWSGRYRLPDEMALDLAEVLATSDLERSVHQSSARGGREPLAQAMPSGDSSRLDGLADESNSSFWNDLCGSQLARSIGVVDRGPSSLSRFDEWYLRFYPYLERHVSTDSCAGRRVLEVGLGYGTMAQRLAASGAEYVGLDVASGPIEMARHRFAQASLPGSVVQGSILSPPLEQASFDVVIAIGSLHHTGNLGMAIQSCRSLLRPGGRLTLMAYYAYSYRMATRETLRLLNYALKESRGFRGSLAAADSSTRGAYDRNAAGLAAPHTDFVSQASLAALCAGFERVSMSTENIESEGPFVGIKRDELLRSRWPAVVGLDLYATAWRAA